MPAVRTMARDGGDRPDRRHDPRVTLAEGLGPAALHDLGGARVAMVVVMYGGLLGLLYVATSKWGGLSVTLLSAVLSLSLAFPHAALLAVGLRGRLPVARIVRGALIELVHGLPLVGLPFVAAILLPPARTVDKPGRTLPVLTIFGAAHLSEMIRAGRSAATGPSGPPLDQDLSLRRRHLLRDLLWHRDLFPPPRTRHAGAEAFETHAIEIAGLEKFYGDFQEALPGIDLNVAEGERVVVCGPSGSGKSKLIRCINRLERHDAGRLFVRDAEIGDDLRNLDAVRRETGMTGWYNFSLARAARACAPDPRSVRETLPPMAITLLEGPRRRSYPPRGRCPCR